MAAPKGQLAAGALSLVAIVGLLALGFSGIGRDTGGGPTVLLTQGLSASSPSTDGVGEEVTRQAAKILERAKREKQRASQEDQKGSALDKKADRVCRMAQHLQDTDDGEAQRARLQKEAATSLEGRAAVLVGEAAKEEETFNQINQRGVEMRDSGRKMLETATQILAKANHANMTDPSTKKGLLTEGHHREDHGGRLVAAAEKVIHRANLHKENSASIKASAKATSNAAQAAMQLGRRFAREAVAHRLKAMTYRSKCTMMRAEAQAALRRAKDEENNARDLNDIAQPRAAKEAPGGGATSLLQTESLFQSFASAEEDEREGEGRGDETLTEFRRRERERGSRVEFERAVAMQGREEKQISALEGVIKRDRKDYAHARELKDEAEKKLRFAKVELGREARLKAEEAKREERYKGQEAVTERLRRRVAALVSTERKKHNEAALREREEEKVESTLEKVGGEADQERMEAMGKERKAQGELDESHNLSKRGSSLEAMAARLEKTAELDMEAARAALQRGRRGARGGDAGVAKDGAAEMATKEKEAGVLRGEARTYRHEATTMQIQAETQGAQAPRDLAAAQKELRAADVLGAHVREMQASLGGDEPRRQSRGRNNPWMMAQQGGGGGSQPVGLLARYMGELDKDEADVKEAEYGATELGHKGKSDMREAEREEKQASSSVEAAHDSEDEDEARVRVLERRLRATHEKEQELRASMHA